MSGPTSKEGRVPFTSYAQNHEDVVLARALRPDDRTGTWIDVGAGDPIHDSVTAAFAERGWTGINIEPLIQEHERLVAARPRDVNLCLALGAAPGVAKLFEGPEQNRGSSTMRAELADAYKAQGQAFTSTEVRVSTLAQVVADHVTGPVDLLKVDVEGLEAEVLAGADWSSFSPRVVVVEATVPNSAIPSHEAWEPMLLEQGYQLALFDGLNRFYARADEPEVLAALAVPANVLDDYAPHAWSSRVEEATRWARSLDAELAASRQAHRAQVDELVTELTQARAEQAAAVNEREHAARSARRARDLAAVAGEQAAVARQDLAASEALTTRALAEAAELRGALADTRRHLDTTRAAFEAERAEVAALRATRTFRHTDHARRVYRRLRRLRRDGGAAR